MTYDSVSGGQVKEVIKSILIEPVKGYAAPLTLAGTMLVDNILVSNYAVIKSHSAAHIAMAPVRWWYTIGNQMENVLSKSVSSSIKIDKQLNGTHWFPGLLHSFSSYTNLVKLH